MSFRPSSTQVPPPKDWQRFERNMRDLYEAHWGATATMHGRTGQPQHGVDIYGQPKGDDYHGVQCKLHEGNLSAAAAEKELRGEIKKATKFKPRIARFILATTAPRDATIQAFVRQFNEDEHKPFTVEVAFWDDILALYEQHADVFERHYAFSVPTRSLHQLRPPVADFTGRTAEIDELLEKLQSGGVAITGVHGLGGIGKTELALALAERLDGQYPDAQIYLDLRGTQETPVSPADALRHVILSFHAEQKLPDDVSALQGFYRSTLHEKRVLLLMDNAAEAEQLEPLAPPPTGCVLLVTSRQQFALPGLYVKNLDTLSPEDARDLLLRICPRIGDAAERIAELCGRLPLALRLAGSALAGRRNLSPDDYVRRLTDEQQRLKHLDKVAASLRLSDALLPDELRHAWYALSIFPGTFDLLAAAAVWGVETDLAQNTLGDLLHYSVLDLNEATGRYRLHDLVRLYAGEQLAADERFAAQQRHAAHYCGVAAATTKLYLGSAEGVTKGLALFDLEWPNIAAGFAWAQAHAVTDDAAARLCSDYPDAGTYCLDLRQHPREKIAWREAALSAARRLADKRAESVHLGNLGVAHADFGEPRRAIELYEQQLTIKQEIGDRRGEGNALGCLGNAYADLGEPRRAIEFYEQALAIDREIGYRRGEGNALGNLGSAYAALGEPRRAIEFCEQQLTITREIGYRRGEGNALGNLGSAYAALGEPRRAIEFYEQALAIDREIGDRRGEGADLGNLGLAYAALGEPRRAIEFYEQQLVIAREIGDRRGEATACWNAGLAHEKLGDLPRAVELMQVCVDYEREIGHPDAEKDAARVAELRARLKA
ncbi:MAG: tetratricopeptide repeat protein [Phycisphaerae bacterium]|jgi:tetratricopeptide (TPR) repeat protein